MAYAPIKLGRVSVKQQSAWGTAVTSFADVDAMDVQGTFIPAAEDEPLGQPVQRPQFGAPPKRAGSRAGGTVSMTWVMTNHTPGTPSIEHQLIADAMGTLQALAAIGIIDAASTTDELRPPVANADWIGQGHLVSLTGGGAQIAWVTSVDGDGSPDSAPITLLAATPNAAVSVGATITIAFDEANLANLPFTIQSASAGANASFRFFDARVSSLTITANSKAQLLCAATLTVLNWAPLDAVVAAKFAFPRQQLGPNLNALSMDLSTDETFCYASTVIAVTNTLTQADCNGSAQGVIQLVTSDRMITITERMLSSDVFADAWTPPGTTGVKVWGMTSKVSPAGSHASLYGPMIQLQKTAPPVDLGGIWGVERVWEVRNTLNPYDSTDGASTVKGTNVRISFG